MKSHVWLPFIAIAGLALAGCGGSTRSTQATTAPPTGSDEAQVASVLAANPDYVNEDLFQSQQPQSYDQASGFAAIRPLSFWREITGVETTFDTEFGPPDSTGRPTTAVVTIHRHLTGTFNIAAGVITDTDTSRVRVRKPLSDAWTRRIALVRLRDRLGVMRWRLAGTSGVNVKTRGGVTQVQSLRVQAGDLDTTITNPLELHRLRRLIYLPEGASVTLTATTGSSSDVVLFYGRDQRRRFTNNSDGTFTFQFTVGRHLGIRHFGVDALSHGTLFDDTEPYDSHAWLFAYVVAPDRATIPL